MTENIISCTRSKERFSENIGELSDTNIRLQKVLEAVGVLTLDQAMRVNIGAPVKLQKEAIFAIRNKFLGTFDKDMHYLLSDPRLVPDAGCIMANEVLLTQLNELDVFSIYHGTEPVLYGFTKGPVAYEVVYFNTETKMKNGVKILEERFKNTVQKQYEDNFSYIFVLADEDDMRTIPKDISFPYVMAVVKLFEGQEKLYIPKVYYKKKAWF